MLSRRNYQDTHCKHGQITRNIWPMYDGGIVKC
jgi:hypothetical protein